MSVPLAVGLLITVVIQGMLGALTVTWQLKPLIVTLHLIFGITTLSLLWWLFLSLRTGSARRRAVRGRRLRRASAPIRIARSRRIGVMLVALIALGVQVALGGWASSNYAAVACPDFPKCQNSWVPETDYKDAFVLWRGLGVNYEGGILQHPARVAIHYTHRLGAGVATLALAVRRHRRAPSQGEPARHPIAAYAVLAALGLQLFIGASMVLERLPARTGHGAQRRRGVAGAGLGGPVPIAPLRLRSGLALCPLADIGLRRDSATLARSRKRALAEPSLHPAGEILMPSVTTALDRALSNEQEVLAEWVQLQLSASTAALGPDEGRRAARAVAGVHLAVPGGAEHRRCRSR